jgi:hypothetical protein
MMKIRYLKFLVELGKIRKKIIAAGQDIDADDFGRVKKNLK